MDRLAAGLWPFISGANPIKRRCSTVRTLETACLAVVSARLIDTGGETFYGVIARKPVEQKGIPPDHDTL